jgi:2-polyprenyl-6-methoxyphenol hydroxylase-like FAD-dependent oxidoreductase
MNLGLRDAAALSQALAEAIQTGSDAALNSYAAERRAAAAEVLAMTDRLTRAATLANPASRWFRNRLIATASRLPSVRRYAARTLAGFR